MPEIVNLLKMPLSQISLKNVPERIQVTQLNLLLYKLKTSAKYLPFLLGKINFKFSVDLTINPQLVECQLFID